MKMTARLLLLSLLISGISFSHEVTDVEVPKLKTSSLSFVKNKGQWPEKVDFRTRMGNGSIFLEEQTFTYVQYDDVAIDEAHHLSSENPELGNSRIIDGHVWKAHFVGANEDAKVQGNGQLSGYHNYLLGNDRSKWASHVPLFESVMYFDLYEGIDLNIYSNAGNFKYDFVVAPGADAGQIKMNYSGLDGIKIENRNLVFITSVGQFIESAPYVYQVKDGVEIQVACEFRLNGNDVSFVFPDGYDETRALIIDPELIGATLSGGTVTNFGHCATYDNDENIYTGGRCFGEGYPVDEGSFQTTFGGSVDISISKLNPTASDLIYATYLGGDGSDLPHSLVASESPNELYVFGTSRSINYPVSDDAFDTSGPDGGTTADIVVTHLTEDGTDIIGSTFVGGDVSDGENNLTTNYGDTYRGEIIVDADGNCYVASCTQSENFPTTAGAFQETYGGGTRDAVVFSLSPDLSTMNWSTYIGSDDDEGAFGLRLDSDDNVYVCGTASDEFIDLTGHQTTYQGGTRDAFVLRLIDNGSAISASSFWGTPNKDAAFFLDLDNDGNVFIYGQSDGGASPVSAGVYSNAGSHQFIAALNPTLEDVVLSTVVGAGGADFVPIAFMVDACGYIYFSGHNAYATLPLTDDALYTVGNFYLGVLQPDALDLEFSTLYSGNHVDGGTSRFDPDNGVVYQAVCSCEPFTTTPDAYGTVSPGGCDVAVFKIDFGISHVNAEAAASPAIAGCLPFEVTFDNTGSGVSYEWDFDDGATSDEFEPTHTFTEAGVYNVQLIAFDPDGCLTSDTTYLTITVSDGTTPTASFDYDVNCATGEVTVTSTGTDGVPLEWDMGDGNVYDDADDVLTHTYAGTGTFTITLTAGDGECADFGTADEEIVIGSPSVDLIFNRPTCVGFNDGSVTLDVLDPTGTEVIEITDGDGTILNPEGSNTANTLTAGWYYYHVDLGDGCELIDSIKLEDPDQINAQIITIDPLCHGDETGIAYVDAVYFAQGDLEEIVYIWAPDPIGISGVGADSIYSLKQGEYTLTINDELGCSRVFDFEINEPPVLEFVELGTEPASCRTFAYQIGHGIAFAAAIGGTPHYDYLWTNLQTGETSINSTWGGLNPGDYRITVTDENDCILEETVYVDSLVPNADFTVTIDQTPTDCDAIVPVEITYTNQSSDFANPNNPISDTAFFFHDGLGGPAILSESLYDVFVVNYAQSGDYEVCLIAQNEYGCKDTACKIIKLCDDLEFEVVNIFTPDGDGINDVFTFVYRSEAVIEFTCVVVDRWGVTIAEFNDINQGWDGTDQQSNDVPDGVYFYTYAGKGQTGEEFSGQGTVNVSRETNN